MTLRKLSLSEEARQRINHEMGRDFKRSLGACGEWFGGPPVHDFCRRDAGHAGLHSLERFNADEDEAIR